MPGPIDWGEFGHSEKDRKRIAKLLDLPETTSWKDLFDYDMELLRKEFTQVFELSEETDWGVICKKLNIDVTTVFPGI